jgi:hypothetical protein
LSISDKKKSSDCADDNEESKQDLSADADSDDDQDFQSRKKKREKEDGEEEEPSPITWYERWFQSKSMQKVVKTNSIQKKLRKKLKKPAVIVAPPPPPNLSKDDGQPIIGSIEEYEQLFGKKVMKINPKPGENPSTSATNLEKSEEPDVEEEEDDNDDLWGDIIGDD